MSSTRQKNKRLFIVSLVDRSFCAASRFSIKPFPKVCCVSSFSQVFACKKLLIKLFPKKFVFSQVFYRR
jgi:hypothetical protein